MALLKNYQLLKKRLWLFILIIGAPILLSCLIQINSLPAILRLSPGQNFTVSAYFPLNFITIDKHLENLFPVQSKRLLGKNIILNSRNNQEFDIQIRLFGVIPIKKLHVEIIKPPLVIPGGQAIGVLFSSKGVVIVGDLPLKGVDGRTYYPAREAGIKIGDVLLAINNFPVNRVEEVEFHLKNYRLEEKYLTLTIKRKNKFLLLKIKPVFTSSGGEKRFMLGLYIEDPAAGVGTLTFYDPKSNRFAGLGHRISEFAGRTKIPFQQGEIVMAKISGIKQGIPGQPGEKIGIFNSNADPIGKIEKNCRFGIYGTLYQGIGIKAQPIPTAYGSEVKIGPAQIYTVINGSKIEHFKVEIIRVYRQDKPRDKGMIIKVVDPSLLKLTGGIIQGMSGSPIIQNGKFVGAVTHVLVNDPTKGYGVLAEWMINEINKTG